MLAKEKHIKKYRVFWFERGFDVLTVRTPPSALLLPGIGGKKNASNIIDALINHRPFYDKILVHTLSVGGFQYCEILNELDKRITGSNEQEAKNLLECFKGTIIDSCVYPDDCAPGLSKAITKNRYLQPLIEKMIKKFLEITKPITMNRYKHVCSLLFTNSKRIPGLILYSKDDEVSNVQINHSLHETWRSKNILTDYICWNHSTHVLHFKEHENEYRTKVDEFVSKLAL